MNKIRLKTIVPIDRLSKPTPTFSRDAAGRLEQIYYPYTSIAVTYDIVWAAPAGSDILSTTQTIEDL